MCVAIAQAKGAKTLTIDELEQGWKANPDGGGYAYIDGMNRIQQLHTMDRDEFILSYLDDHESFGETSAFLVHMRIATHGEVHVDNTHPFNIPLKGSGEMVFMHNGIISELSDYTGKKTTDTQALANEVFIDLEDRWLDNPHLVEYIEQFIGYSKLAFLSTSPSLENEMYILNGQLGVWVDLTWHSNYSCFEYAQAQSSVYDPHQFSDAWAADYDHNDIAKRAAKLGIGDEFEYDDMESMLRFYGSDVTQADWQDRTAMMNESIDKLDACTLCFGIESCYCSEVCNECREVWMTCLCKAFISMEQSAHYYEQGVEGIKY